ncbi:MAG: UvrD-helicase domain-containing protein [Azonexus sp.]
MKPTQEQQLIIEANEGVIKVTAFAGTGKTSTLIERAKANVKRTLYLAFNKSVQVEAEARFPKHVTSKTQHGLAYAAVMTRPFNGVRYTLGRLSIFKTSKFFRIDYYMASLVHKTVENFCQSADPAITTAHAEPDKIGRYTYDISEVLVKNATQVWAMVVEGRNIDFPMTHSGYLKLFQLSKPKLGYPVIMLDEAQDTNPVVHDIVLSQANYGSQIILVGDPYQQIYAWRGAVDALGKVEAKTYYITQSFRFGTEVAGMANHILNAFFNETRPLVGLGAPGTIAGLGAHTPDGSPEPMGKYTFLARTNAFLFAEASRNAGKLKMFVPGSGQNGELPIFQSVLDVFALFQGRKQDIRDFELKNFADYWELLEFVKTGQADPEWNVATAVVEKYKEGVPQQIQKIRDSLVPSADLADVTLITAHRAKGLEWDHVVLGSDYAEMFDEEGRLRPLGDDRKTEIAHDEVNLVYVAATRAKKRLTVNHQLAQLIAYRQGTTQDDLAAEAEVVTIESHQE